MKFVFLGFSFLFLSACNLNQNISIRGVDLHSHRSDGSTFVEMESIISLGNLNLPNSQFMIKNPNQREIGEVSIQQLDDGTNRIAVSLNYDEAEKMESTLGQTLPNGREIPSILGSKTSLTGIQILENSRIYLGGSPNDSLYAGIALNIPAFDHILSQISSPLNLFMPFNFSDAITASAGIYSSPHNQQNGIAIFAKMSQNPVSVAQNDQLQFKTAEFKKVDRITRFRLDYLFNKHATLRIK